MAEKLYWRIYRQRADSMSKYEDIVIEVFPTTSRDRKHGISVFLDESEMHEKVELRWQSERNDPGEAYGFRVELETKGLGYLAAATKAVERILRDMRHPSPDEVIERLERLRPKAERVVLDPRLGGYLQPARVPPPEIHRFIDNWRRVPGHQRRGATVDTIAPVGDGAVDKIDKALAGYAEKTVWRGKQIAEYAEAWREAGKPILDTTAHGYGWKAPTIKAVKTIIHGE